MNVHHSLLLSLGNYSAIIAFMISLPAATGDRLQSYDLDMSPTKIGVTGAFTGYLFGHSGLRICEINSMMKTCLVKKEKNTGNV